MAFEGDGRAHNARAEAVAPIEIAGIAKIHLGLSAELSSLPHLSFVVHYVAAHRFAVVVLAGGIGQAAIQRVVGNQTLGRRLGDTRQRRLLPFVALTPPCLFGQPGEGARDLAIQLVEMVLLLAVGNGRTGSALPR